MQRKTGIRPLCRWPFWSRRRLRTRGERWGPHYCWSSGQPCCTCSEPQLLYVAPRREISADRANRQNLQMALLRFTIIHDDHLPTSTGPVEVAGKPAVLAGGAASDHRGRDVLAIRQHALSDDAPVAVDIALLAPQVLPGNQPGKCSRSSSSAGLVGFRCIETPNPDTDGLGVDPEGIAIDGPGHTAGEIMDRRINSGRCQIRCRAYRGCTDENKDAAERDQCKRDDRTLMRSCSKTSSPTLLPKCHDPFVLDLLAPNRYPHPAATPQRAQQAT